MILYILQEHSCQAGMEAAALMMLWWACLLVLRADDNLLCRCLHRECHALDCGEDNFLSSQSLIAEWQPGFREAGARKSLSHFFFSFAASFLWCQKLYHRSATTGTSVWTWLGHNVPCCLARNPSICFELNETLRSHQTFLEWVSNQSALSEPKDERCRSHQIKWVEAGAKVYGFL